MFTFGYPCAAQYPTYESQCGPGHFLPRRVSGSSLRKCQGPKQAGHPYNIGPGELRLWLWPCRMRGFLELGVYVIKLCQESSRFISFCQWISYEHFSPARAQICSCATFWHWTMDTAIRIWKIWVCANFMGPCPWPSKHGLCRFLEIFDGSVGFQSCLDA